MFTKNKGSEDSEDAFNNSKSNSLSPNKISKWYRYKDIDIEKSSFEKGILIIKPSFIEFENNVNYDDKAIEINARKLVFSKEVFQNSTTSKLSNKKIKTYVNFQKSLVEKLIKFNQSKHMNINYSIGDGFLYNEDRREEIYLPLCITDASNYGFYTHVWLNNKNDVFNFVGFERFVGACCMFGAKLKAYDQFGCEFPIIKHDIKFHPGQNIISVVYNNTESNFYEKTVFEEIKASLGLYKALSKNNEYINVVYHLPYYDYILFGVELFIKKRISTTALEQLINIVLLNKEFYINNIEQIGKEHGINFEIKNPFQNLFGNSKTSNDIFSNLNLFNSVYDEEQTCSIIINKLYTNTYDLNSQQAWLFLKDETDKIKSFDALFKIANCIILAIASEGTAPYKVCSLLPLSEKQIQITYSSCSKNFNQESNYHPVFNMTMLDTLITKSQLNTGKSFYFNYCNESLVDLISYKKLIEKAHSNIFFYSLPIRENNNDTIIKQKPPFSIEEAVEIKNINNLAIK